MAFFNDLGGKIKNAGQSIANSTKNFADVTKLKKGISDNEKQIAELYAVIGKSYYENHKDDSDAENKEDILKINTLVEQVEELKQQIREIEGFKKCPNCGSDVPVDALFCNQCGSKIEKEAEPEAVKQCPNCGKDLTSDSVFCSNCGCKITNET